MKIKHRRIMMRFKVSICLLFAALVMPLHGLVVSNATQREITISRLGILLPEGVWDPKIDPITLAPDDKKNFENSLQEMTVVIDGIEYVFDWLIGQSMLTFIENEHGEVTPLQQGISYIKKDIDYYCD